MELLLWDIDPSAATQGVGADCLQCIYAGTDEFGEYKTNSIWCPDTPSALNLSITATVEATDVEVPDHQREKGNRNAIAVVDELLWNPTSDATCAAVEALTALPVKGDQHAITVVTVRLQD